MTGVPYTFSAATAPIPLSQLDANFNTTLTIGGTSIGLGNTTSSLANLTLSGSTTATGRITQSLSPSPNEYALKSSGQTTGWIAFQMDNTGGSYIVAGENSAGNNLITGDSAYDLVIRSPSGTSFSANAGASQHMRLTSAGVLLVGAATDGGSGGKIAATSSGYVYGAASTVANSSDVYYFNFTSSVGGQNAYIYRPTSTGVTALFSVSDKRLKENIVDVKFSGLDVVSAVKVREFDWKDSGTHSVGFIAQELHTICPDAVAVGEDDADGNIKRPWAVTREALVPYLIKAVQEQQATIAALEARLTALETK